MARPIPDLDPMEANEVAQDDDILIDDVSADETKRIQVGKLLGLPLIGWTATGEIHAYSSWSASTRIGVVTVPSDATAKYSPGMRYQFTQATGGTKYAIIVKVTSTTLTLFLPSGTTLNNETISNPYYSVQYSPLGFNLDPSLWELTFYNTQYANGAPSASPANITSFSIPIGAWDLQMSGSSYVRNSGTSSSYGYSIGLSTTSATFADTEFTTEVNGADQGASSSVHYFGADIFRRKKIHQNSATTWYLVYDTAGSSVTNLYFGIGNNNAVIRATCAYI